MNTPTSVLGEPVKNPDIQIERWPVERLSPSDANPRTHLPEQVAQIAASIREFGFVNPILVAGDGETIAGEARLRAAQKMGILKHLSEVQRRTLAIADNQLALNAGWDQEMLREQLAALKEAEFNLEVLGFDDQELACQLAEQEASSGFTDEDEVPDLPTAPVSRIGDLWLLGLGSGNGLGCERGSGFYGEVVEEGWKVLIGDPDFGLDLVVRLAERDDLVVVAESYR